MELRADELRAENIARVASAHHPHRRRRAEGLVELDDVVVAQLAEDLELLLHRLRQRLRVLERDLLHRELGAGGALLDLEHLARHAGAELAAEAVRLEHVVAHDRVEPPLVLAQERRVRLDAQQERRALGELGHADVGRDHRDEDDHHDEGDLAEGRRDEAGGLAGVRHRGERCGGLWRTTMAGATIDWDAEAALEWELPQLASAADATA